MLGGRQRHNFIDDLEPFFWVYAWIMTVQNGPGLKNLVPDSEKSDRTLSWETNVDPSFHVWKRFYLRDEDDPQLDYITEYFSKLVYLTLFHSFRTLLHADCDRKTRRPKGPHGNFPEIDCFDEMEEIYAKIFDYFDVAIKALSPTHKLPSRTQPIRQAKLAKRLLDEDVGQLCPNTKKARVDQTTRQPK